MNKKRVNQRTLGPISSELIYKLIEHGKEIFTLGEAAKIYGKGRQETSDFLGDLMNRGLLARIVPGTFLILKMGQENTQLSNWPIIAQVLAGKDNYYISHYSAMRLHGMTTHPLSTVTITITKKRPAKKIHNHSYQFVYSKPAHFWGNSELWVTKQEKVSVSNLERTILDGLDRPDLCGGIKEVIRGIWAKQKSIDWDKLIKYSKKYHTRAAIKRLGFILEMLDLPIDPLPLLETINMGKDYVALDPNGPKLGKHLSRWRLLVNMNIDELKASVWG